MTILAGLALLLGLLAPVGSGDPGAAPPARWLGPEGEVLPFHSDEEVLEFLRTAEIVSGSPIPQGINRPLKLLLVRDGVRAHAVFRSVNTRVQDDSGRYGKLRPPSFRDHFGFECAAYELGRLLGYARIPPVVERRYRRTRGSLQLWVENAIDETTRKREDLEPPDRTRWLRQMQSRRLFDSLIGNYDRNTGNLLFDRDWNLWLIDHTRSFPADTRLEYLDGLKQVPAGLWQSLCELDRQRVVEVLSRYLTRRELDALLTRWQGLVALLPGRGGALAALPACSAAGAAGG